ncbi:MAG: flagellar brake protein [Deltaproteobacteria bacterium]|nr:flagellar brake protein [Candidatus Anaeroferrophillus wilburensis]MBN2888309.1 flagellar brake protein [Deltaproteobacteria bacterium]
MELYTPLHIQLDNNTPGRFKSFLVGMEEGRYMIVKLPSAADPKALFTLDRSLVVRYLHRGSVFGFKSKVMGVIDSPAPLLFICYPEAIEDHNLRNFARIDCYLPARLQTGKLFFDCRIVDISKGGCQLAMKNSELEGVNNALAVDQEVGISFCLPGVVEELLLAGIVRTVMHDDSVKIGIKFNLLEGMPKAKLYKFLATAGA